MTLPRFWRRAAFSVAEAADILAVPVDTLRTWMAREPSGDFIGARQGGRVYLSGNDIYFYAMVRDFTAFGVAVRVAMHVAKPIADFACDALPPEKLMCIRGTAAAREFAQTNAVEVGDDPVGVVPIRRSAEIVIERCAEVYANEEGAPVKLGTIGRSPAEIDDIVDQFVANAGRR